jgi:hypothetical protein
MEGIARAMLAATATQVAGIEQSVIRNSQACLKKFDNAMMTVNNNKTKKERLDSLCGRVHHEK